MLASPAAWIGLASAGALWAIVLLLSPLGLTSTDRGTTALIYEIAFLVTLGGTALSLSIVDQLDWFLRFASPLARLGLRTLLLAAGGSLGLAVCGILPGLLLGDSDLPRASLLPGAALSLTHLAILGTWLSRAPIPKGLRSLLLALLAWVLPSAVGTASLLGRTLTHVFDVSRHLDPDAPADARALLLRALPLAALLGGAALLEMPVRPLDRDDMHPR